MARGRLDARLSTGGPTSTLRLEDPHTSQSAEFTIRFELPKGARLLLTWTVERVFTRALRQRRPPGRGAALTG